MKKNYLLLSVLLCLLTISGTVLATNYGTVPNHVKKVKPLSKPVKPISTITFTVVNNTAQAYDYVFDYANGGVAGANATTYITVDVGTYMIAFTPRNDSPPMYPPNVNFVLNDGVGWYGNPGFHDTAAIGTGSGQASSMTINLH